MADNRDIFNVLLRHASIELNLKSSPQEHTALYYALLKYESGDDAEGYAASLIKNGAQADVVYSATCDSLLETLIREDAVDASALLVQHARNVNHANANGETALHLACGHGTEPLIGRLLAAGAQPNSPTVETRRTPLHYAVMSNALGAIRALIGCNSDGRISFNVKDANGDTPLSLALNEGFKELVPTLIEGRADVNVKNGKDFTLLHQAILKEDGSTAIFLLDNGADMNAKYVSVRTFWKRAKWSRLGS